VTSGGFFLYFTANCIASRKSCNGNRKFDFSIRRCGYKIVDGEMHFMGNLMSKQYCQDNICKWNFINIYVCLKMSFVHYSFSSLKTNIMIYHTINVWQHMMLCRLVCKYWHFGRAWGFHHMCNPREQTTLKMEAASSYKIVLTYKSTWAHIPEDWRSYFSTCCQ
jgi:hypothetical protein